MGEEGIKENGWGQGLSNIIQKLTLRPFCLTVSCLCIESASWSMQAHPYGATLTLSGLLPRCKLPSVEFYACVGVPLHRSADKIRVLECISFTAYFLTWLWSAEHMYAMWHHNTEHCFMLLYLKYLYITFKPHTMECIFASLCDTII